MNDVTLSIQDAVQTVDTNAGLKTAGYGLSTLGPGLGIDVVTSKTVEGIAYQPEMTGRLHTTTFLNIAFTEALALIDLVAGFVSV